jgi:hypothetical protein
MGLVEKTGKVSPTSKIDNTLNKQEYEFLFNIIKNSTFKGEHLEILYNLTLKLQNQYVSLKD